MELLRFEEKYFCRIWGGHKLHALYGKPLLPEPTAEAWLVSDHPAHESVVGDGPRAGVTLRRLLEEDPAAILGSRPQLTIHGRFPLLLKLLDATSVLSVQVHPDDACARRLGESDVGKTETWYVLQADPGSELVYGLQPGCGPADVVRALRDGALPGLLVRVPVAEGMAFHVPAGTVHAIGAGMVVAEIQQNSDLTYRLYDWDRRDARGQPRELHIDKALQAISWAGPRSGPIHPLEYTRPEGRCSVLAVSQYFTAERIKVRGSWRRETRGESFHILLASAGDLRVEAEASQMRLRQGEAAMAPGCVENFTVSGEGAFLDYYVADFERDVVEPLVKAGHTEESVRSCYGEGAGIAQG